MDEALAVGSRESVCGLQREVEHLALTGRAVGQDAAQRLALEHSVTTTACRPVPTS